MSERATTPEMDDALSEEVRQFLLDRIESVVELETLLLLRRLPRLWSGDELASELRIEPGAAGDQLAELAAKGLLIAGPEPRRYRYHPSSDGVRRLVDGLAAAYEDRRVTVISLIYSKPRKTVQVFADAFRLRKDDADG